MKLIYKPIGITLGLVAAMIGRRVFTIVWGKIDDEDPPSPTTEQVSWPKLLAAAALQGVVFRLIRVTVDRFGAKGWTYLTGAWPGERRPDVR